MATPRTITTATHGDFDLEVTSGTWPSDISGEMVFSAPMMSGKLDYGIFDFGGFTRLSLNPGTHGAGSDSFAWRTNTFETPSKRLYDAHPEVFMPSGIGYMSPYGQPNNANTAPLPWGDRLFATWDAGRPVEIDPVTLEYVAEVGHIDSWGGASMMGDQILPFIFSTAHPIADPERDVLWTCKLTPVMEPTFGMQPSLVMWDRDGTEVKHWPLKDIAFPGSCHTLSQTRDWVIIADSGNFKPDAGEMGGGERTVTVDESAPVWLVRKDVLMSTPSGTPVEPVCFTAAPPTGHYYAKYDDSDGISVIWEGMNLMDLAMYVRPDDTLVNGHPVDPAHVGVFTMSMAPDDLMEFTFDPETGKVLEQGHWSDEQSFNMELSGMDWSTEGLSNPTLHHLSIQGVRADTTTARAAKLYEGRIDLPQALEDTPGRLCSFERGSVDLKSYWEYQDLGDFITSPIFAPRSAGEGTSDAYEGGEPGGHDGYVVQPILSDDGFRVDVFDAANVGAGPVATLEGKNKECVPLILHSSWMPVASGLVDAERLKFSDEITDEKVNALPEELRGAVGDVVDEFG